MPPKIKSYRSNDASSNNQTLNSTAPVNKTNNSSGSTSGHNTSQMSQAGGPPLSYANFTAPIIDFSFKNLSVCQELYGQEPRAGEKVISKDKFPESNKSNSIKVEDDQTTIKRGNRTLVDERANKMMQTNNNNNNNITVDFTVGKQDEKKEDMIPEIVKYLGRGVKLCNNNLTSLNGIFSVLSNILELPNDLVWIDLSFNSLTTLEGIDSLPETLTTLYLHANNITSLNEIAPLQRFRELKCLTLLGNPIEDIRNYRFCILSIFPNLKSFDRVTVTERDRETAKAYRSFFWPKPGSNKKK